MGSEFMPGAKGTLSPDSQTVLHFFAQYYHVYLFFQEEKNFALLCLALDQERPKTDQAHAETIVTVPTLKYVARLAKKSEAAWIRL